MKRAKLLLLTLLAVVGWNTAQAETVSSYTVDFNTAITPEGDFAVAPNWGHVVNTSVSYSYVSDGGVDGSGALRTYTNQKSKNSYDLLVTPLVSGTVTLYVKPLGRWYNNSAILEFYSMDENGETRGDLLAATSFSDKPNSEEWDWYALTITIETAQRIGIRASEVYFDDFSASSAEIVPQTTLKVTGVMNSNEQTGTTGTNPTFNQGPDGNTVVTLKAKLQNTGNVDLVAGVTENYTLTLAQGTESSATTYFEDAPFDIPVNLAAGETKIIDVEFTVPATITSNGFTYFYLRENVSGTTSNSWRYCELKEYASMFIFDVSGTSYNSKPSPTNKPIAFGKVTASTTLNYEIYNAGAAPLVINSFTLPEGYTSDAPTSEFTVSGGEKKQIAITLPATTPGIYSGNLTIEYTNYGKTMSTYTLAVTGTVLDPSKNFISFDNGSNGQFPAGSIHSDQVYITSKTEGGTTNWYLQSTSTTTKFITPLLTAEAGESFTYDTWYSTYSYSCAIVVYISKDRVNWTQVDRQTYSSGIGSSPATFTVTIPEAGNYYLAFELISNALLDNIYGLTLAETPAHDWYIISSDIPNKGKQNNDYTASVNVQNINAEADVVETATLYVNGEAVATVTGTELSGNAKTAAVGTGRNGYSNIEDPTTISFTFKPHVYGTFPTFIELKSGNTVVTTEVVNVNFAEEKVESDVAISGENNSNVSLLHLNWNNSESVTLYTPAMLENAGLKSGDVIESITYKGYCSNSTDYSTQLSVWYESTTDASQSQPNAGKYDTSGMTQVLSETHTWTAVGSSSNWVDMITINLAEPIVYDGNALRFVVRSEGTTYKSGTYFEVTSTSGNEKSYYNRNDNANTFANSQAWSQNSYVPAIHFGLKVEAKTFSGLVTEEDGVTPVAGATVTIRNDANDIEYFATTDETGAYTINVVQNDLAYTATVTADGYETLVDEEELNFTEGSRTKDFVINSLDVNLTISSAEYATFYYSNSAYKIPEGLEAFVVESIHGNALTLIPIFEIIPADCGVIIKGPQGTYVMKATSEEGAAVENLLLGYDIPHLTEGGDIYYKLTVMNDKVGFYWGEENGEAFETAAHKAYLALRADQYNDVKFFTFDNDSGNATGIDNATGSIETNTLEADRVYNLSGQRVNDSYKGVVIVNGKKVMRK